MKNLTVYCCHLIAFVSMLASSSCGETTEVGGYTDKIPENVRMSDYTSSSITVSWNLIDGVTSYTAQLLDSLGSNYPIDGYTTSYDFYRFSDLEDTRGYYVRVRANVNFDTGDWIYIMNGEKKARIMPKYGFVNEDFEEPETDPDLIKELYPNFPEGFENAIGSRKGSHSGTGPTGRQSEVHPTGEWLMPNMYTHSVGTIAHKIGTWAVMMNFNVATYLEMDFDLPLGASKFSFYYGTATKTNASDLDVANRPIVVKVEYSQNGGKTWRPLGDELLVTTIEEQYFKEYELNINGPVRFRMGKDDSRARLMVDEIAIYTNY